jgi:hypothetical protein
LAHRLLTMGPPSVIFVPYASPNAIITAGVLLPALGIITVLLRFYIRSSRKNSVSVDDWLVIPALVCKNYIQTVNDAFIH